MTQHSSGPQVFHFSATKTEPEFCCLCLLHPENPWPQSVAPADVSTAGVWKRSWKKELLLKTPSPSHFYRSPRQAEPFVFPFLPDRPGVASPPVLRGLRKETAQSEISLDRMAADCHFPCAQTETGLGHILQMFQGHRTVSDLQEWLHMGLCPKSSTGIASLAKLNESVTMTEQQLPFPMELSAWRMICSPR